MPSSKRTPTRRPARRKRRRARSGLRAGLAAALRSLRWTRRVPLVLQLVAAAVLLTIGIVALNWTYQVARKPSELLFPVSGRLYKTPAQTWRTYAPLFRLHATRVITPHFLAALAQLEASGNPIARTYWRFAPSTDPFDIYRPASSAVGMYQLTDGTFAEARRLCVHGHEVVETGPWHDFRSCWFNALYTRVLPSHAIELTSAYLDRRVAAVLDRYRLAGATPAQQRQLAAVIHLCGATAGARFAAHALVPTSDQRCGAHSVALYLQKLEALHEQFVRLDVS